MLNLFDELWTLVSALNERGIDYALCGGLALAVHGIPRATIDLDLLVPPEQVDLAKDVAAELGYTMETDLSGLAGGKLQITRLTKFDQDSEDFVPLDLLHVEPTLRSIWDQRVKLAGKSGDIWVVPAKALISMKEIRGSKQDMADIERLKELENEG